MSRHQRPAIGGLALLVYRECPCGNWLATGEGAMAPICSECREPFVPGGGPQETGGAPMFGSTAEESRRIRGLAFVAFLTSEIGAVDLIGRVRTFLGLRNEYVDLSYRPATGSKGEHYTDEERRQLADEMKGPSAG